MRLLSAASLLISGLLVSASAHAEPPPAAAPVVIAPPVAAPPPVAPQAVPIAPANPAAPTYTPGYVVPPMMYRAPGAGAPPPYWTPIAPATERNSNAMRSTGIVLFTAGAVITTAGAVVFGAVATTGCAAVAVDPRTVEDSAPSPVPTATSAERVRSSHQALNGCDTSPVTGAAIIAAGMLTAAVGVPLFVIGSKQVPARTMTGKLAPELRVGAANASLRWSF